MVFVGVKLDGDTLAMLQDLEALEVARGVVGAGRSVAIRSAIRIAHAALVEQPAAPATAAATLRPGVEPDDLKSRIIRLVADLHTKDRGRLIPLPEFRRALVAAGIRVSRATVDEVLLKLERERALELRIAQSPATLGDDRKLGIERPGRGLVYWISMGEG